MGEDRDQENIKQKRERKGHETEIQKAATSEYVGERFSFFRDVTFPQKCSLAFCRESCKAHSETPQGVAPRLTSRKHRARLSSQTKKHRVYLWGTLAAKTCYKGESLQNSAVASKPIVFPGQKK